LTTNFIELGISKPIASALETLGFIEPTEIQERTIPLLLAGQDVLASAQTGSGKTAAYALPVIERLKKRGNAPRALVLVPTRELGLQVEEQFGKLSRGSGLRMVTLYGGTGYGKQIHALQRGVDIIVATPGRLQDHLEQKYADISKVEVLVLDEADRMLDMGFLPPVRKIMSRIPKERQTMMFSATIDARVERIAAEYLRDPAIIRVIKKTSESSQIDQRIYHVAEFGKDALLAELISKDKMESVLVFTKTRRKASWVKSRLREANVLAEEIHGDIRQSQRERTLTAFRKGQFNVLVATDVAARGLDVPSISHVINYDLPESPEDYVHRIGRTGRAGKSGVALSFVSEGQRYLLRDMGRIAGKELDPDAQKSRSANQVRRFRTSSRRRRMG
jgi:ATP-dependent RNA helicase RhlE